MGNELIKITTEDKVLRITSVELVEIINTFRQEEGKSELQHNDFMKKIRRELETLKTLGLEGEGNISLTSYVDTQGKERPCFYLDKDGMLMMLNSESTLVRFKTVKYIDELEKQLKETKPSLTREQELVLAIYNGGVESVQAAKELTEMKVKEAVEPLNNKIELDRPKVEFTEAILKSKDNILVRELAKIISDEVVKIGQNKLYDKLREWNYIMKGKTEPYQSAIDKGYFVVKESKVETPYGVKLTKTTLVTPLGQIKIVEKFRREYKLDIGK